MRVSLSFLLFSILFSIPSFIDSALAQSNQKSLSAGKTLPRRPINAEEKSSFMEMNSGPFDQAKTLINPPVGNLSPEIKKSERYFNGVMKKLLDQKPFDGEVKVKINFYAQDEFGFYSRSMKEMEDSWGWNQKNINRDWPMRRFLGVNSKATPIYEIGVTTDFLRKIKSEDQLAFFMAKELGAIRETLYNPDFDKGALLAKQVESTASDVDALAWMKKAGYSPEASIDALDLIYKNIDPKKKVYPVLDALKGDAHEGVRYGAVQAQLENLKRTGVGSLKTEITPIPEYIQLTKEPRSSRRLSEKDFQALRVEILKTVKNDFISTQPSQYFLYNHTNGRSQKISEYPAIEAFFQSASRDQVGALFKESVETISLSQKTKQMKGNASIRLLQLFNPHETGQPPQALFLSDDDVYSVTKKFKEFTLTQDGWKANEFLKLMHIDLGEGDLGWRYNSFKYMTDDQTYQKIFSKLFKGDREYQFFLKQLPEIASIVSRNDKTSAEGLISYLSSVAYREGDFQEIAMKNGLEKLKTMNIAEAAKSENGFGLYRVMNSLIKEGGTKSELLKNTLIPQKEIVKKAFLVGYEKRLTTFFSSPINDINKTYEELNQLGRVMEELSLSPDVLKKSSDYLLKLSQEMVQNPKLLPTGMSTEQLDIWDGPLSKLFADALNNSSYSKESKITMMDFVLGNKDPEIGLALSNPATKELVMSMQNVVSEMTPAEIHKWVGRDLRAQYGDELAKTLSEAQSYPVKNTDAGLKELIKAINEEKAGVMRKTSYKDFKTTKIDVMMREWSDKQFLYGSKIKYMISNPIQRNINILSVMGADHQFSQMVAQKFTFSDLQKLIKIIEKQRERAVLMSNAANGFVNTGSENLIVADNKGGTFLLDLFDKVQADAPSLDAWHETFLKIKKTSPVGVREDWQTIDHLGTIFSEKLTSLPATEIKAWLKKDGIMDLIPQEKVVPLLRKTMKTVNSRTLLADEVTNLNTEYDLQKKYPQAFKSLKANLAEEFLIQPGETEHVFQDLTKTTGQSVRFASEDTRALSGLISLSRKQSTQDQIDLIEYLMGRKAEPPAFIFDAAKDTEEISSIPEYVREMRARLVSQSEVERALIANTFLAGPHSFMETEKGLNEMVDYLLKDVSPNNKTVANELAQALIRSEGRSRSLGVAYVLGQKAAADGAKLAESRILKSLFEAYGVPGIKLGQYLAFTSELQGYRAVLEELQDSAMPLTYLDSVKLCEERFGKDWPSKIQITGMKGSGSVNVALTYKELDTGKTGVFSILRSNIENSTKHDFFRFQNFIKELTKTPEGLKKYGYLAGLSDVIDASVALEFDKVASMKMQQYVKPMYQEEVMGWKVRTIDAYEEKNKAIFMQEAPGKGARKIFAKEPETYKSAMKALSRVEMDRLLGIGPDGKPRPVALYANPDFHDGQVLIDIPNKKVTLLDFGQAVKISNEERELGVDILRVISKVESPEKAARILNTGLLAKTGKTISVVEIGEILQRTDRMDIFIKLISTLGQKKMDVPLSTVHWILAANRQIALGEKIGVNNLGTFRNIVIADKIGAGQRTYNWLRLEKRKICDVMSVLRDTFSR